MLENIWINIITHLLQSSLFKGQLVLTVCLNNTYLFCELPNLPNGSPARPPSPMKMYRYPSWPNRSCPPLWLDAGSTTSRMVLRQDTQQMDETNTNWQTHCITTKSLVSPLGGVVQLVVIVCWQCELADSYPLLLLDRHRVVHIGFSDRGEPKHRRETDVTLHIRSEYDAKQYC